ELINGAIITLFGADNPDSLRGLYHDGVVIDEYGNIPPSLWGEIVAPAVADRDGWVVFIGTPAGPNHFYELWKEALADEDWFTKMLRA
ncbi:terminase large subunit domain-containing protein, partial [Enterococcus faecalis]|uniref:terminase large subunit domain-containing protein n=1 Tax=Enterococcus faecalis TaxID=1351 RepID=UPI003D6AA976